MSGEWFLDTEVKKTQQLFVLAQIEGRL